MAANPSGAPLPRPTSTDDIFTSEKQISIEVPTTKPSDRPQPTKHVSEPSSSYSSPLRHHQRAASTHREVKETLNARSEYSNSTDDGTAQHRINQYTIKQEIGRGSFGSVHLAVDQYGHEYAVKEFSKSRLRKRAQSNLLRRPNQPRRRGQLGMTLNSPLHRQSPTGSLSDVGGLNNSLDLIKEEIAIMKKLNHPNVVSLIEVLDDPDEDSLYMVLEMCKKGVVMRVGLYEEADPYEEEQARCWFRDLILGIEYLHAQGIIHRDLKPDNCLITNDDVLKIVDFGVSEMFSKESDMHTSKSAGSPAFMPPELCVAKHGHVSGRAADIWSMGATLYCLRFGKIPFHKEGIFELYESIRSDPLDLAKQGQSDFGDLMRRLLEKDPSKRIDMEHLREHPWVTRNGTDPLLPPEENVAAMIETTDEEVNAAITGNMGQLLVVMKAVKRFKTLLVRRRPDLMEGIFGRASRIVAPPQSIRSPTFSRKAHSIDPTDRRDRSHGVDEPANECEKNLAEQLPQLQKDVGRLAIGNDDAASSPAKEGALQSESTSQLLKPSDAEMRTPTTSPSLPPQSPPRSAPFPEPSSTRSPLSTKSPTHSLSMPNSPPGSGRRGQAHDPLEDVLFLYIGAGPSSYSSVSAVEGSIEGRLENQIAEEPHVVCESPSAAEMNVYETAYEEEVQRIQEAQGQKTTIYLTRRVEGKAGPPSSQTMGHSDSEEDDDSGAESSAPKGGLAALLGGGSKHGISSGFARLADKVSKGTQS